MTTVESRLVNQWFYSVDHQCICQLIEVQSLWGETTCRVWLPGSDAVVRIPASTLKSLDSAGTGSPDGITYVAAAARVADALTQDVLLAPIESSVIPLPHQIRALSRAIANDRVRYLLADEVGLGKTIEAGLILRELKLRGLVKRTLVIAPKGLVSQWVSEMRFHFGETFQLVLPEDIKTLRRIGGIDDFRLQDFRFQNETAAICNHQSAISNQKSPISNPWQMFSQVVVPMDSVKPMDKRRGWTKSQVHEYNRERFEDLISAGWDLVIVDEAHRLGGSTDQVARFKLGQGLSEAAPYFLLLSATPHQGKTDAFHRLMSLIDAQEFPDVGSVTRERVQPHVIRTEKRRAIDAEGKPLFKPRRTEIGPVSWEERHRDQQLLYEAVTEYVREGYNQAMREKRSTIGFLMILMQRLVVSSTSAIRTTLERRLDALKGTANERELTQIGQEEPFASIGVYSRFSTEEWEDLDGQEQIDMLLGIRLKALKNERAEVKLLLDAAARCEQTGPDAKAEALLDWLYRLQSEEGDTELKALVFTEFVPTQEMLQRFLTERGFSVVCLNGSMDMEERKRVQEAFAHEVRILISTDAGGEGLNLQFCHVVINYDIPWNPMRLEQRIGRVDRIGQPHTVRAVNFVFEDSVEHRVREVLEQKLAVIFEEFGIDKTGDVLDSAQAGRMFDEMYLEAILNPEKMEESVDGVIARLQDQVREARTTASVLGATEDLEPGEAQRLLTHPLPHWVERMTVSYLKAHGGQAERKGQTWNITWPDGEIYTNAVFTGKEAERFPTARHLTLEEPKIRGLAMRLPRFAPGQPVPVVSLPGVPKEINGVWSLWRIAITTMEWNRRRIMPLFLADDGRVFMPTARHVWDQLLMASPKVCSILDTQVSQTVHAQMHKAAEEQGKPIYEALVQEHRARIAREREKADYAFAARRKTIERIGLPQVRNYRLALLAQEEKTFQQQLDERAHVYPEMVALLMIRVEGNRE
ncbi:DEAD/DEAH box helicase [Desulfoferrobacter suflitae]|uniref:DEAD/DEAH box helicase n=1 Tax=Desulfoferrobacter suflitae TaxID=2865782 RepID=UPI0021645F4A|nr:DEAD/DEAH box helicase [Desulfoferrobacter suflitae]MCK8604076.1 DEAD/DEAH box helicase [Desulfoferrobacter suflitae]